MKTTKPRRRRFSAKERSQGVPSIERRLKLLDAVVRVVKAVKALRKVRAAVLPVGTVVRFTDWSDEDRPQYEGKVHQTQYDDYTMPAGGGAVILAVSEDVLQKLPPHMHLRLEGAISVGVGTIDEVLEPAT